MTTKTGTLRFRAFCNAFKKKKEKRPFLRSKEQFLPKQGLLQTPPPGYCRDSEFYSRDDIRDLDIVGGVYLLHTRPEDLRESIFFPFPLFTVTSNFKFEVCFFK